jgi:hypothetical protein
VLGELASRPSHAAHERALSLLAGGRIERVRPVGAMNDSMRHEALESLVHVVREPVDDDGYQELRHYVKEQSVTTTFHRYGNLGLVAGTEPAEPSSG